jgi:hypothetical protein
MARHLPHRPAPHVPHVATETLTVLPDPIALQLLDLLEQLDVEPVRIVHIARGVGARDDTTAEVLHLLNRVDGDVPGARDDHVPAVEGCPANAKHLLDEVGGAIAGRLLTYAGAAPRETPCLSARPPRSGW